MKSYELHEFDSSKHQVLNEDVTGGSRPRVMVRNLATKQKSLIKIYKEKPTELWAEMMASKLGSKMGFEVQATSLRIADVGLKSALKEIYGDRSLENWNGLVAQVNYILPAKTNFHYGNQFILRSRGHDESFSLKELEDALRSAYPSSEDLLQKFADMVVFDFIIGNSDRHSGNWAIAVHADYPSQLGLFRLSTEDRANISKYRAFAKLFDHGDSLLYELEDRKVTRMINEGETALHRYTSRAYLSYLRNEAGQRACLFDVIAEKLRGRAGDQNKWKSYFKAPIDRVKDFNQYEVAKTIAQMPNNEDLCYSSDRKDLLLRVIQYRLNLLKKLLSESTQ
ncbi:MAG TPA: hypothetical protein VLI05_01330 [Candidatus Saccharimonadia bacterium]|nr:hypothetical protein [Candidatus Saccharimonadia bacterium]